VGGGGDAAVRIWPASTSRPTVSSKKTSRPSEGRIRRFIGGPIGKRKRDPRPTTWGIRMISADPWGSKKDLAWGDALRRDLASGVGMSREPGVGQEFREPASGMSWQTLQDVLEIGEGIDLVPLCSCPRRYTGSPPSGRLGRSPETGRPCRSRWTISNAKAGIPSQKSGKSSRLALQRAQ
jgi:hypothetical protein